MKNIAVILILLLGSSTAARMLGAEWDFAGRMGMTAVFAFTAVGHFVKRDQMAEMIPPWMPWRKVLITASGGFEGLLAVLLLMPSVSRYAGLATCVFLVAVTPLNIYAAIKRIDFGGHSAGPVYLLTRLPLQILLIGWTYWFAVRTMENSGLPMRVP